MQCEKFYNFIFQYLTYVKSILIDDSADTSSSKCIKSEISTTCPASNWKFSEIIAYISGASAKATASFKQYKKDVYLQTITRTVTISCNKSGKLY